LGIKEHPFRRFRTDRLIAKPEPCVIADLFASQLVTIPKLDPHQSGKCGCFYFCGSGRQREMGQRHDLGDRARSRRVRWGKFMTADMLLLVEDDPFVQDVLETSLTDDGFQVVGVQSGAQAVHELQADPTRFRAVITDIRLGPGPDGWAVARAARELVATIPIIYVSGDSASDWPAKGVRDSEFMRKPLLLSQLTKTISRLLHESPASPMGRHGEPMRDAAPHADSRA
jgi:CheY-like chemotaxis protein